MIDDAHPLQGPAYRFLIAQVADNELRVSAAVMELPPDYQEVIMLRNLQRLPFAEVAERMGRSRPAVQMLWMRAIKRLQAAMSEEAFGSPSFVTVLNFCFSGE